MHSVLDGMKSWIKLSACSSFSQRCLSVSSWPSRCGFQYRASSNDWLSHKHSQICNCTEAKKIWGLRKECSNAVESSLLKSESTSSEACSNYGVHQPECAPQKSNRISDSSQVANRLQVSTENWQRLIEELSTGLQTGMIYGGASAKLSDMAISMPQR